ncbi:MAG TPA: phage holin family protein [Anaerolineaceae bacterium]|nr:phage holin family protein [Anaerolineaceae bacterium]HOV07058.1 phage holin family protein [Anaerolineaceae bacterium]
MRNFILRVLINAGALFLAVWLLRPHILMENDIWYAFVILGLIFGLVNAFLKPLLMVLSCPLIILTLGLGTLVVNTLLFLITGWLGTVINFGFVIPENTFWYAFLGALIVSIASFIGTRILDPVKK